MRVHLRRGEPLLVLILLIMLWIGARAAIGRVPPAMTESWRSVDLSAAQNLWVRMWTLKAAEFIPSKARLLSGASQFQAEEGQGRVAAVTSLAEGMDAPLPARSTFQTELVAEPQSGQQQSALNFSDVAGAVSGSELIKNDFSSRTSGGEPLRSTQPPSVPKSRYRWTADGWVYVRGGVTRAGPNGGTVASYAGCGGSQAGAVLRYALGQGAHDPIAFLRMSGSLGNGAGSYREMAAGLSVRPSSAIPLAIMAEVRSQQSAAGVTLRPAATVVTQLPPQRLPGGFQAEVYGQGGYVAGKGATAFYDGQVVVDRPLRDLGPLRDWGKSGALRVGAGAWAGGQAGASRLDLGPTASARLPAGRGAVRLSVDWRFRVAGNAEPGSGLAATVAAGF